MSITLEKGYLFAGYINGVQVGHTTQPVCWSVLATELAGCTPCGQGQWTHGDDECPSAWFLAELVKHGNAECIVAYQNDQGMPMSEGMVAAQVPITEPPVSLAEWILASALG